MRTVQESIVSQRTPSFDATILIGRCRPLVQQHGPHRHLHQTVAAFLLRRPPHHGHWNHLRTAATAAFFIVDLLTTGIRAAAQLFMDTHFFLCIVGVF